MSPLSSGFSLSSAYNCCLLIPMSDAISVHVFLFANPSAMVCAVEMFFNVRGVISSMYYCCFCA